MFEQPLCSPQRVLPKIVTGSFEFATIGMNYIVPVNKYTGTNASHEGLAQTLESEACKCLKSRDARAAFARAELEQSLRLV